MASTPRPRRTKEEFILLLCSILSIVSVLPFGIYRALHGNWFQATVDFLLVVGISISTTYVLVTGRTRTAAFFVSSALSSAILLTVYLNGPNLTFWIYPMMVASFFILRPRLALSLNGCSLCVLMLILSSSMSVLTLFTVLATILLVNLFAYIFSSRTYVQQKELDQQANLDFLTSAGNRRALERRLTSYYQSEVQTDASLIMFDLDHFKHVNDKFGHAVGDMVLARVCGAVRGQIRDSDEIFRFGGEEFVVLLKGATLEGATRVAEELRNVVAATELIQGCQITISLGVCQIRPDQTPAQWLQNADELLYRAKNSGRNCVVAQ